MRRYFFAVCAAILLLIPLFSCEIGLGEAVDTAAPTVSITYPDPSVFIRGTFKLEGNCSDDKELAAVYISLLNTDLKKASASSESENLTYGPYTAVLNAKKTSWSVELNKYDAAVNTEFNGWELPDGKYTATVYSQDAAGRTSGNTSLAFEIDNTAPLFIMKGPASLDIDNPTAFGSSFKVSGTMADDHTVKTLVPYIYKKTDKTSDLLDADYYAGNVENAGSIEVTIAKKGSSNETLSSNYTKIYGDTSVIKGTYPFYFNVVLTDASRQYTDFAADSTAGNSTSVCYLNDSIYDYLLNSASLASNKYNLTKGLGLEASQIKEIVNGTYNYKSHDTTITAQEQSLVKTILADNAVNLAETNAAFSLNPDASPKYSVSGFSFTMDSLTDMGTAAQNNKVIISAKAGRDGTYIKPETMVAYVFGPYEDSTELQAAVDAVYAEDKSVADYAASEAGAAKLLIKQTNTDYKSGTVESYNMTVTLTPKIINKKYYIVAATGVDQNNLALDSDNVYYGFAGALTGAPPSLEISTPSGAYIAANKTKVISGTVSDGNGIASLKRYIVYKDGTVSAAVNIPVVVNQTAEQTWTDSITTGTEGATVRYVAENIYGNTTTKVFIYYIDVNLPIFTVVSPSPLSGAVVYNKNNVFQVTGTAKDDNTSALSVYYLIQDISKAAPETTDVTGVSVTDGTGTTDGKVYNVTDWTKWNEAQTVTKEDGSRTWTINVKLSSEADSTYKIYIAAVDVAGNVSLVPDNVPQLTADSAAPEITILTVDGAAGSTLPVYYTKSEGLVVTGTLTEANIDKFTVTSSTGTITVNTVPSNGTEVPWKFTIPATCGNWNDITITATDKAEFTSTKKLNTIIDNYTPTLEPQGVTSGGSAWVNETNKKIVVRVGDTGTDGSTYSSGISTAQYTLTVVPESGETTTTTKDMTLGASYAKYTEYSAQIDLGTGTNKIKFNVKDAAGNEESTAEYTFKIDKTGPTVTCTNTKAELCATSANIGNDYPCTIKITAKDDASGITAGTASVALYKNNIKQDTAQIALAAGTDGNGDISWTIGVPKALIETGTNRFTVRVYDIATNYSETQQETYITADTTPPKVVITAVSPTVNTNYVNGTISVTGSVEESNLSDLSYSVYLKGSAAATATVSLGAKYNFTQEIDTTAWVTDATQTAVNIVFTATDAVGNTGTKSTTEYNGGTSFIIDQSTDKPVINITNASTSSTLAASDISDSKGNLFNTTSNNKLLGTITDDDGIASYTVTAYNSDSAGTKGTQAATQSYTPESTTANINYSLASLAQGYYLVEVTAKDTKYDSAAEAIKPFRTALTSYNIGVDNDLPVVSVTTAGGKYVPASSSVSVTGTASDTYALASLTRYTKSDFSDTGTAVTVTAGAWNDSFTSGTEGATVYYLAKDAFGKKSSASFTYLIDAYPPAFTITQLGTETLATALSGNAAAVTKYAVKNSVYQIKGTVNDTGGSGLKGIYYYVSTSAPSGTTAYTPDSTWTACTVNTTTTWTANIDLSAFTADSTYTVYIAAVDEAGNVSPLASNPCKTVQIVPDAAAPVLAVTTVNNAAATALATYYKGSVTVEGTLTETNLAAFTVTPSVTPSGTTITVNTTPASGTDKAWKFTIPATTADYSSIVITATDKAGQSTSKTLATLVDMDEPTVDVPQFGMAYWMNASTQTYTVPVSDKDGYTVYSDIASVAYALSQDGINFSTPVPMAKGSTDASKTDYTDYNSTIAFADGTNTINVIVTDNAGNVHIEEGAKTYSIDTVAPTSTLTSTASLYTTTGADAGTTLASGGTYLAKGAFNLGGTITEATSGFTSGGITLSVTKDGAAVTDVTSPTEAGPWTYNQAAEDGLYVYTLSLTDQANNKNVYTVTVRVDTTAPELVIKNPTAGDSISSPLTMQFSAPDSGSGLQSITYTLTKLAKGSDSAKAIATDKEASGSGNTRTSAALDFTSSDYGEGTYTLSATAKDVLGNATTTSSPITFYYDKNPPTVTETGINTSGKTTNAAYTLTGSASDSNELAATNPVTVVDKIGDTEQGTYYPGVSGGAWSLTLTPNGATADAANKKVKDGIHTYSITVKDVAGKTATITRTVTSDNTVPTWNTDSSSDKEPYISTTASNGYYKTTSISIAALASDATSGIAKLQYSTDGTNYSDTGNGSFTVNASEGSNTIYVRAVDAAGNMTSATTLSAKVDTTAPASCELASLSEGGTKLDDTTFAAIKAGTSTLLVNKTKDIAFTVTDSDGSGSGIDTAKYAMTIGGSDAGVTYSEGTLTVAKGKLSTGAAVLTVTDKAGNSAKFQLFQVQVDADAPVAAITSPAVEAEGSTTLNGKKTVSGTVTEAYTPESISLYYATAASDSLSGWQLYKAVTTKAGTTDAKTTYGASVASIYNWSMSGFDFTTLSGSSSSVKTIYLLPVAYDKAGNCNITDGSISSSNYVTYYVNQDADRPVIQFTNLTLTGMTSSNHIWLKNSNVVYGTIRDDDGITSLSYSLDAGSTWNAITVTNGTWSLSVDDGAHTIYFMVVDTEGTTFTSAASGTASPKLYDGTTYFPSDTLLYLSVDKTAPAVKTAQFAVYDTTTSSYGSYSTSYADTKFGGIHSQFNIQIAAKDTNGIASVTATFGTHSTYTGTSSSTDSDGYSVYILSAVDCSKTYVADGSKTLTVTVTDGAGLTTINTFALAVDNTPPVISIINPSSQVSGAETLHGSVDSTSTVYYAVSSSSTTTPGTAAVDQTSTAWAKIIDASLSWNVYFDAAESTTQTHTDFLKYYIPKCSSVTKADIDNGSYKTLTTLYFWIKAVDESGNVSTANKAVVVDPQGDRPKVTLSYPAADGVRLGGTIRLIGTVSDNTNDAAYAWVQIHTVVSGETSSDFNATDQSLLSTNGYTLGNMTDNTTTTSSTVADNGVRIALTGSSWNLNINEKGEFNPSATGTTNTIIVTVYATDAALNLSSAVTRTLVIDKDTPVIVQDTLKLVQYETSANSGVACTDGSVTSGTVAASRTYKEGMSIKGVWFLTGKITDDSGLKKIVENGTEKISAAGGTDSTGHFLQTGTAIGTAYNYTMNIPVGNSTADSVGTSSVTVTATENTEYNLYIASTFSVNYDNKAPVLTTSGDGFNISADIVNSDGFYTFGSVATEAAVDKVNQTGVERIAFYLTRDVTSPAIEKLYDVMIVKGGTGNAIASYKSLIQSDGLYWKTAAVSSVSGAAITLSATDVNIHVGGLAKVNGTIYRIDSIDSAGLVITLSDEPGSATTAYFALANVVDNTTAEGKGTTMNSAGYYTDGTYDDGDLMMESIIKQSTSYTWEANINSKNISDGTIVLHYVVFDAAGNYSEGSVSGAVKNNQPRIAGVSVGTDYNADNTVSSSEWNTDNALSDTASYKTALDAYTASPTTANAAALEKLARKLSTTFDVGTAATPVLTAKGLTQIKPEIVGGNGALYYSYSDGSSLTGSNSTALVTAGTTDYTLDTDSVISLQPGDLIKSGDSTNRAFTFKIWDSTEGMTARTDSQYATIIVHMGVSLSDVGTPVAYISPFYWRSASANSLYGNSSANGHIELEGDWLNASGYTSGSTSGTTDDDPKVSGKVVIRGTAHDDRLISAIYLSVPAMTTQFTSAGCTQSGSTTFYKMASYSEGTWTCNGNLDTYGFVFAVDTDTQSFSAKGHTVHWTFTWDTSKITNVAAADVVVQAMAVNFGTPSYTSSTTADSTYKYLSVDGETYYSDAAYGTGSASATTSTTNTTDTTVYATLTEAAAGKFYTTAALAYAGGTADAAGLPADTTLLVQGSQNATYATVYAYAMPATPYYRVDVVPYVTKINTGLDSIKQKNPSVFSRTALGHYPVSSTETFTISGFNLTGATVTNATSSVSDGVISVNVANSTNLKSGALAVTVNSLSVLNNKNYNESRGSAAADTAAYANYYNRQPNGDNNENLTDDIVLDVWQFDSSAVIPISGKIEQPVMKINPKTGQLGFAFVNGPLYFSMGGTESSTEYSYDYWMGSYDFFTSVGFAYDKLGYSYGVAAGGDINSNSADKFQFMTSRWGPASRGQSGSYSSSNSLRLESIGMNIDGTLYFDKQRIKSPSFATAVHGTATDVYLAYYDAMNGEIRLKYGQTTSKATTDFGLFTDYDTAGAPYVYRKATVQILAASNTSYSTGNKPGEYVSIGVVSAEGTTVDDKVVAVWYDQTNNKLMYSYNETPTTSITGGNTTASGWVTAKAVFGGLSGHENAGEYCQLTVDKNGGIHIAGYDPSNCDLVYAYLSAYNSDTFNTCVVDASGVVGSNITIDVALNSSGKAIPYIGYYATSCARPKCAYLVGTSAYTDGGANADDEYTGKWECAVLPSASKINMQSNQYNKINIGVWKSAGTLTTSTTGTKVQYNNPNSYSSTSYGSCFGNGTSNAVLGYAIKVTSSSDAIETAQMR